MCVSENLNNYLLDDDIISLYTQEKNKLHIKTHLLKFIFCLYLTVEDVIQNPTLTRKKEDL